MEFGRKAISNQELQRRIRRDTDACPQFRFIEAPLAVDKTFSTVISNAVNEISMALPDLDWVGIAREASNSYWDCSELDVSTPPQFLALDFAIIEASNGTHDVRLVELQGAVPTVALQWWLDEQFEEKVGSTLRPLIDSHAGKKRIKTLIPDRAAVVEVDIDNQQNLVDMILLSKSLDCSLVDLNLCLSQRSGTLATVPMHLVSRLMLDQCESLDIGQAAIRKAFAKPGIACPDPLWSRVMSKIVLPKLDSKYCVPIAKSVYDVEHTMAGDWVIKPVFGRGGHGVSLNPVEGEIRDAIESGNSIVQQRINYAEIATPSKPVKVELRVMCTWQAWDYCPEPVATMIRATQSDQMALSLNRSDAYTGMGSIFVKDADRSN